MGRQVGAWGRGEGALLGVAAVWGATFVMVKDAVAVMPPMTFNALRCGLAVVVLLVVGRGRVAGIGARLWGAGVVIGLALCAGYVLQVFGLQTTTPARAGFFTGVAVVLVPFLNGRLRGRDIAAAAVALAGIALLSLPGGPLGSGEVRGGWLVLGDWLVLGCAVAFALQIVLLGRFAPQADPVSLATVQVLVMAAVCALAAPLAAPQGRVLGAIPSWSSVPASVWIAAAFTGILATAAAFVIQAHAQRATTPERTALIFATEPLFAAVTSWWLIGEKLSGWGWLGGTLIVTAMVTAALTPSPSSQP